MSAMQVRPFSRDDREQVTALINSHAQAVVPGVTVSVQAVLRQLEREPGETIVDPWVSQRLTLVAEQRGSVVAAAHLLRYGDQEPVGAGYRGLGELRWLVCAPPGPNDPGTLEAGAALVDKSLAWLVGTGARRVAADGALPVPGVYGIPEQWPHLHDILSRCGFSPGDRSELVYLVDLTSLGRTTAPEGLSVRRTLGVNGTRLSAFADGASGPVGYVEVELVAGETGLAVRQAGWADVGNLWVDEPLRRRGVGTWLLGEAAAWLRLGHVDRLLDYCDEDDRDYAAFLESTGFQRLTRTTREWVRGAR
jgi:GNAT superfamily N-acetyltransferase